MRHSSRSVLQHRRPIPAGVRIATPAASVVAWIQLVRTERRTSGATADSETVGQEPFSLAASRCSEPPWNPTGCSQVPERVDISSHPAAAATSATRQRTSCSMPSATTARVDQPRQRAAPRCPRSTTALAHLHAPTSDKHAADGEDRTPTVPTASPHATNREPDGLPVRQRQSHEAQPPATRR